jgi:phenylacetate-CoA ligase
MDEATVLVEVGEGIFFDEMKKVSSLRETIRKRLHEALGVTVEVKLVERKSLERTDGGKAVRVVDRRGK